MFLGLQAEIISRLFIFYGALYAVFQFESHYSADSAMRSVGCYVGPGFHKLEQGLLFKSAAASLRFRYRFSGTGS